MEIKAGSRWRSVRCLTEVIVVRAPKAEATLGCGGSELVPLAQETSLVRPPEPSLTGGSVLGKRYVGLAGEIELLCTRSGDGALTVNGEPLMIKDAKPLPASD